MTWSDRDEKKIMGCLDVFTKADCLTEKEHKFFEDLELFFRVRTKFICRHQFEVAKCKLQIEVCIFHKKQS